jgi:hypothetical protein
MTVWRVLRKRLEMKPYRLHLVQFLHSFWYKVYIPRFIKIGSGVQKLIGGIHIQIYRDTHRQHGDLITLWAKNYNI